MKGAWPPEALENAIRERRRLARARARAETKRIDWRRWWLDRRGEAYEACGLVIPDEYQ